MTVVYASDRCVRWSGEDLKTNTEMPTAAADRWPYRDFELSFLTLC